MIQANNDVEKIRVLQVGRDEVPEAMKTLQRGLEADADAEELVLVTHPVETLVEAAATVRQTRGITHFAAVILVAHERGDALRARRGTRSTGSSSRLGSTRCGA